MYRSKCSLGVLAILVGGGLGAISREPARAGETPDQAHAVLVRQLGSASFEVRQRAAREIIKIGVAARPALMRATKDVDLERRLGARRVLIRILQDEFDARLTAFLEGKNTGHESSFPGWPLFRKVVGDGFPARHLYADMVRGEMKLLHALAEGDDSLSQLCTERLQLLASNALEFSGNRQSVSEASLATMLFAAGQANAASNLPNARASYDPLTGRMYSLLVSSATRRVVLQGTHSRLLKRLLIRWVEEVMQGASGSQQSYCVQLALKYELRELGPRVARQILQAPNTSSSSKPYAAIVLARFGGLEDAPYLVRHLKDTRVFHTWSNPQLKKEPIRIQVRDVMLAMLARLSGQDPAKYGFKLLDPYPETLYRIWTFGFIEDKAREEAFEKWNKWSSKNAPELAVTPEKLDSDAEKMAVERPEGDAG